MSWRLLGPTTKFLAVFWRAFGGCLNVAEEERLCHLPQIAKAGWMLFLFSFMQVLCLFIAMFEGVFFGWLDL